MRLHHLEITAFGPFAETVSVDFDRLTEAQLFLLSGATGAGKSTILDAVCFALYGDVPSDRAAARQLRSQHAADGIGPRVVLELTIGARRFRFTRSPAWERPKKRGTGTTTEHAHVLVEEQEHAQGAWIARTHRLDEAGHLVAELLGMSLDQFGQVVLLPQGQFDTFLRASSEERQRVLTTLFRTARFERVEQWLAERRRALGRDSAERQRQVAGLLHRLSEATESPWPEGWDPADLTAVAGGGELTGWVEAIATGLTATVTETETAVAEQQRRLSEAAEAAASATRTHELWSRYQTAERARAELDAGQEQAAVMAAALDAADRAEAVRPVAEMAQSVEETAASARSAAAHRLADLERLLGEDVSALDGHDLREHQRAAAEQATLARGFLPRARELESLREEIATAEAALATGRETIAGCRERLAALPELRATAEEAVGELTETSAGLVAAETALAGLDERLRVAATLAGLDDRLTRSLAARLAQQEAVLELQESWLQVRERRLEGIAAELAVSLAVGADCPVCGSLDHPSPARSAPGAPTRADEEAALKRLDDAKLTLAALEDQARTDEHLLAQAREAVGERPVADLEADRAVLLDQVARARAATAELPRARAAVEELVRESHELELVAARESTLLESTEARLAERRARHQAIAEELDALLAGADDLPTTIAAHQRLADAAGAAREALVERERAERAAAEAAGRLVAVAAEHGFGAPPLAAAARLEPAERESLRTTLADRAARHARVEAVLTDPETFAAGTADPPDVAAAETERQEAATAHERAVAVHAAAVRRAAGLERLRAELDRALTAWAPLREEHARVRSLAELAEGKGPDNSRQMRLSAYVLAARLGQVVAAANERLAVMSDHRYLLEHTAERAVGDRRGGLSLAVRDQWTDEARDPVTLSGGESFVVSLALALGLADVVTAESGGIRVDTLFVDEGFGALDATTLELVMDTLDQLRAGGRAVGVVSHVAEMRTRIPVRLDVVKGRDGSTVLIA